MGAKKKVSIVDLSQEEEQVKTSRKRAKASGELKVKKAKKTEAPGVEVPVVESSSDTQEQVHKEPKQKKSASAKTAKTQVRSSRYQAIKAKVDPTVTYSLAEAVKLVKETSQTKFTGTIEAHLVTIQKGLRGFVSLPHFKKQGKTVLVFGMTEAAEGILIGDEKSIDQIAENKLVPNRDFSMIVATPQWMPKLAKVAKILGPKGLMPNPKSGTVTDKPAEAIKEFTGGKIEYRTEQNAPVIHMAVGKADATEDQLVENLEVLLTAIGRNKIDRVSINATMGPGIKIKLN